MTIHIDVPPAANRRTKDKYAETCSICGPAVRLTQDMDVCPGCGEPIEWTNSPIADTRYRRRENARTDAAAKERRHLQEQTLSEAALYVLDAASANAPKGSVQFIPGEANRISAAARAYGMDFVRVCVSKAAQKGNVARGLIKHTLALLALGPVQVASQVDTLGEQKLDDKAGGFHI